MILKYQYKLMNKTISLLGCKFNFLYIHSVLLDTEWNVNKFLRTKLYMCFRIGLINFTHNNQTTSDLTFIYHLSLFKTFLSWISRLQKILLAYIVKYNQLQKNSESRSSVVMTFTLNSNTFKNSTCEILTQ